MEYDDIYTVNTSAYLHNFAMKSNEYVIYMVGRINIFLRVARWYESGNTYGRLPFTQINLKLHQISAMKYRIVIGKDKIIVEPTLGLF